MTIRPGLNCEKLRRLLNMHREAYGMSWREVAAEADVPASTLTRLKQGKKPDVDAFARLVFWLQLPADQFLVVRVRTRDD